MSKNKHLTLDDRIEIQECLAKGMTFKAIANRIGKNQTPFPERLKHTLNLIQTGIHEQKNTVRSF